MRGKEIEGREEIGGENWSIDRKRKEKKWSIDSGKEEIKGNEKRSKAKRRDRRRRYGKRLKEKRSDKAKGKRDSRGEERVMAVTSEERVADCEDLRISEEGLQAVRGDLWGDWDQMVVILAQLSPSIVTDLPHSVSPRSSLPLPTAQSHLMEKSLEWLKNVKGWTAREHDHYYINI